MNLEDAHIDAKLMRQAADDLARHLLRGDFKSAQHRLEIIRIYYEGLVKFLRKESGV